MPELVFVYGSLKRGFENNHLLETSRFISEGFTPTLGFEMYSDGFYPQVCRVHEDLGHHIQGELYEVEQPVLARLDELEQNGTLYEREKINVYGSNPMTTGMHNYQAWIYLIRPDLHFGSLESSQIHLIGLFKSWIALPDD